MDMQMAVTIHELHKAAGPAHRPRQLVSDGGGEGGRTSAVNSSREQDLDASNKVQTPEG